VWFTASCEAFPEGTNSVGDRRVRPFIMRGPAFRALYEGWGI